MISTVKVKLQSAGNGDIIDITPQVEKAVTDSKVDTGSVNVFVAGSTAGITTMEYEPGLLADFKAAWERLVPENADYRHNNAWGDGNGHSHVRASLLGPSLTIPITGGKPALGTWQQVVLVDFDNRSRSRLVILQLTGE